MWAIATSLLTSFDVVALPKICPATIFCRKLRTFVHLKIRNNED